MKIDKLEYLGLLLQEIQKHPKLNAMPRLLTMYAESLKSSSFSEEGQEFAALYQLIALPPNTVAECLKAKCKNFVFTKAAKEVIANIRVTRELTPDKIKKIGSGVYCLNFDKKTTAFVWKCEDDLFLFYTWNKGSAIELNSGSSDGGGLYAASMAKMYEATKVFHHDEDLEQATKSGLLWIERVWQLVIQTVIFLELTDPEIELVKAGKKHSQRPLGTSNNARQDVYIVNSTWNKFIVRTEGFGVSGHFRMQRHGKALSELKLAWIQPYQKHGYVRGPKHLQSRLVNKD